MVDLTSEGQDPLERAERAQESLEDEVLAALSEEERSTLRRLLRQALDRPPG